MLLHCLVTDSAILLDVQAVRIALQVKKFLVDRNILNVPLDAFERILFFHLLDHGFSGAHLHRYLRVSAFMSHRVPLVVLLSGPKTELRRSLAQGLASRLNMQNVQQSDLMYAALMSLPAAQPPEQPMHQPPQPQLSSAATGVHLC